MSSDSTTDFNSRLATLRAAYYARLPDELAHLQQLAAELHQEAPANSSGYESARLNLQSRLHRLAGSAGSFGLGALGLQARALEQQLRDQLQQPPIDSALLTAFVTKIHHLDAVPPAMPTPPSQAAIKEPRAATSDSSLIYVIEHDQPLADELCLTLHHFGHEVQHFTQLAMAQQQILTRAPSLIICASELSESAGHSLTQLQAQLHHPVPVIFMSNGAGFNDYLAAVRAGAVGYFVKPLDTMSLVNYFEHYLDPNRSSPYRILLVDDDQDLCEHYRLILGEANMRVEILHEPTHLFDLLDSFHPELILLDINMPHCSGPELAQAIRLNPEWMQVAITYLSSESDLDKRLTAMSCAGDGLLDKNLNQRELIAAVSMRAARSRQLNYELDRDSLSGLLKHSRIKEVVDIELARAKRRNTPLSLVMLDLDHFKQVNDTHGHAMGDQVIKAVAHLLRQYLRKTDAIGRYGGEEFLIVLPDCNGEEALKLIERTRSHFKNLVFKTAKDELQITASAGVACYSDDATADQLVQAADAALYQAKHQGRNRACLARDCTATIAG